MRTIEVVIEGVAPGMMQHKFGEAAGLQSLSNIRNSTKAKPEVEEEAEAGAYRLLDGTLVHPGEHIFQSMVKAAAEFQIVGRGKKTYKDAIKGGVLIEPEYIPLQNIGDGYLIDTRPVRVQSARIMRARPLYPTWKLEFAMQVIDDAIPFDVLNGILVRAGQAVGLGDYRPRYGRLGCCRPCPCRRGAWCRLRCRGR